MGTTLLILAVLFILAGSRDLYIAIKEKNSGKGKRFRFAKSRKFRIIAIIMNFILILLAILLIFRVIGYSQ